MDLMTLAMELIVGRLVLDLPKEDLKKVNEMIKRNLESLENESIDSL